MSSTTMITGTNQEVYFFDLSAITAEYYLDDEDLRPGGEFIKGYQEIRPYEDTAFAGVTLKKTRNGKKAKSGHRLEHSISPVRQRGGVVSTHSNKKN